MPPASTNKAIFLSYASEDAVAARNICEALRLAGVEVWLDQNALSGGDEWDRKIRRQIRECALFLPIISTHTQARPEGYFRLEWHLAEQRSHLIAKGRAFIVPIAIDATADDNPLVPDAFMAVQWTRMSGDQIPPAFIAQIQRLINGEAGQPKRPTAPPIAVASSGRTTASPPDGPPQIPDYELLRLIGQGSYGDVWLARGLTGIFRAIKIVWRTRFADAQPYEREFRGLKEFAAISLGDGSQMALLHVGRNDELGFFYYVMELADDVKRGRAIDPASYVPLTLSEVRTHNGQARVPTKDCLRYGVELARVLAALHQRGLIHRDIKPANVILVGGVAKLADIGLVSPEDAQMTYVGTQGFVPPEGPGSASADVFALGRVLYELATGLDREEFPQLPPNLSKLPDYRLLLELNEIIVSACDPVAAKRYPDGAALLADLSTLQAGHSIRRRRIGAGVLRAALSVTVILTLATASWWLWHHAAPAPVQTSPVPATAALPQIDRKSVAVLAFTNMSSDKEQEYFSDGISEELLTLLQKIPGLRVTARTSSFSFKDSKATVTEIGKKLNVAQLIEGSVRRIGHEVRITVRLSNAVTGEQIWADSFTRDPKDVFTVQSEIAQTVVTAMQQQSGELRPAGEIAAQVLVASKGGTKNPAAYDLYLQGKYYANPATPESFARAEGYFRRATELDPAYALAFAALARAHLTQAMFTTVPSELTEHLARAGQTVGRALALEPALAEGYGAKAELLLWRDFDLRRADQAVQQALALAPRDPAILSTAALLAQLFNQLEKSVELGRQATTLDPLNEQTILNLAGYYALQRRYPEAELLRRRLMQSNPDAAQVYFAQADDYTMQGRFDEAVAMLNKERVDWIRFMGLAMARWGQGKVAESDEALQQLKALGDMVSYSIASVYAYRGDVDQAFAWLERGLKAHDVGVISCRADFHLTNLHADPRWPVWLRKLGLHDDQLAEYIPDIKKTAAAPSVATPPAPLAR